MFHHHALDRPPTVSTCVEMSSSPKSKAMARSSHSLWASVSATYESSDQAFTVVSAATLAIGGLYYAGLKSKSQEQQDSIYSTLVSLFANCRVLNLIWRAWRSSPFRLGRGQEFHPDPRGYAQDQRHVDTHENEKPGDIFCIPVADTNGLDNGQKEKQRCGSRIKGSFRHALE